ncbi:hypothetical protein HK098_001888 [Nowakowskiella sp. JEL0407]|nr:hypothetical protein HK098_001888 [Nowakowskiella sp. JEL0407]
MSNRTKDEVWIGERDIKRPAATYSRIKTAVPETSERFTKIEVSPRTITREICIQTEHWAASWLTGKKPVEEETKSAEKWEADVGQKTASGGVGEQLVSKKKDVFSQVVGLVESSTQTCHGCSVESAGINGCWLPSGCGCPNQDHERITPYCKGHWTAPRMKFVLDAQQKRRDNSVVDGSKVVDGSEHIKEYWVETDINHGNMLESSNGGKYYSPKLLLKIDSKERIQVICEGDDEWAIAVNNFYILSYVWEKVKEWDLDLISNSSSTSAEANVAKIESMKKENFEILIKWCKHVGVKYFWIENVHVGKELTLNKELLHVGFYYHMAVGTIVWKTSLYNHDGMNQFWAVDYKLVEEFSFDKWMSRVWTLQEALAPTVLILATENGFIWRDECNVHSTVTCVSMRALF